MALETYQDLVETDPNEAQDASFAKISAIYDDGVTLIFDGMEEATQKRYQTNSFVVFKVGDRVRVIKDSGTYIVEYPVGAPRKSFDADYALGLRSGEVETGVPIGLRYNNGHYYITHAGGTMWRRVDNE